MRTILTILSAAIFGLSSCSHPNSDKGKLEITIHEDKETEAIKEGDTFAISYIEKTEQDSILHNTYDYDRRPVLMFRDKPQFKGDFNTAIGMLSEGDSATFKIDIDSVYKTINKPKPSKGKYIIYQVKIEKVLPRGSLNDSSYNAKIEAYSAQQIVKEKMNEEAKIKEYILSNRLKPNVTKSGLYYIITKKGVGTTARAADTVKMHSSGRYLSGKLYSTSYADIAKKEGLFSELMNYQPLSLIVGSANNRSIEGIKEAITLFPKGTKATLIIPSKLAFQGEGYEGLPPYTPLICEMEIVDILPSKSSL